MPFIEIRDGLSINTDKIELIERDGEFNSIIHTHFNKHKANFPFHVILQLLHSQEAPKMEPRVMQKLETVLDHSQHFAG